VIGGGNGAFTWAGAWAGWLTLAAAAERAVAPSRTEVAIGVAGPDGDWDGTGVGLAWLAGGVAVGAGFVAVGGWVAAGEGGACDAAGVTVGTIAGAAAWAVGVGGTRVGVADGAPCDAAACVPAAGDAASRAWAPGDAAAWDGAPVGKAVGDGAGGRGVTVGASVG
jgi:hypothetical protein